MTDKSLMKKRLPATGSDGDLPSAVFDDQFDLALRKLRDPLIPGNSLRGPKTANSTINAERPKLLTLTTDYGQTPILRLALDTKGEPLANDSIIEKKVVESVNREAMSSKLILQ